MKQHVFIFLLLGLSIMLFQQCGPEESTDTPSTDGPTETSFTGPLFVAKGNAETGIDFVNQLSEPAEASYFFYQYNFNGGGVALGDINNDGLSDIVLTANELPDRLYLNKGNFQFEDITASAGIVAPQMSWSTGVTMADVNGDGWLDIYISKSGFFNDELRQNQLFINNQDLTFTERAASMGVADAGHATQAAFLDYDLDGDLDLFILNHPADWDHKRPKPSMDVRNVDSDKLYQNQNGTFTDVSAKAGLVKDRFGFGLGVSVGDLTGNGYPDLYIGNDYIGPDYLYINQGNGTFKESVKENTKKTSNFSMGTDIGDYNNDGFQDIVVLDMVAESNERIKTQMSGMNPEKFFSAVEEGFHYQYMFNTLQLNNGDGTFIEVGQMAGITNTDWSWSPLLADFDNDGMKDLFITNGYRIDARDNDHIIANQERTYQKDGDVKIQIDPFQEIKTYPVTPLKNYVFKNNGDYTFQNKSQQWGIHNEGFSQGAAYADLDNDGDLDMVINNLNELCTIYENKAEQTNNNYIKVALYGPGGHGSPNGAKVEITMTDGQKQVRELQTTRGYQSAVEPVLHFGLGQSNNISSVKVIWDDSECSVLDNVEANQTLVCAYDKLSKQALKNPGTQTAMSKQPGAISFRHKENKYDDYEKEVLLPHQMSTLGPCLAKGDVDGDGDEDLYIGGAAGQSGGLFLQESGTFKNSNSSAFSNHKNQEDAGAHFFDADGDGDLDLYVSSGGNEQAQGQPYYLDRLYLNNGNGQFQHQAGALPTIAMSTGKVLSYDYDSDGDLDLIVAGRQTPGKYPMPTSSYIFNNNNGSFSDVTKDAAPDLLEIGMVTDMIMHDYDSDGSKDLVLVGEWMSPTVLKNSDSQFELISSAFSNLSGWYFSVSETDVNGDGKGDLVFGNLGLNYKYKATSTEPFHVYYADFDGNGSGDIVLGYYNNGQCYPVRGRECSSDQMPVIKKQFPTYQDFSTATIEEVLGGQAESALHLSATDFSSYVAIKNGDGYDISTLPPEAQFAPIYGIVSHDFNNDGHVDLFAAGNLYNAEVETPRADAGKGIILLNDGSGSFEYSNELSQGIDADGDVKAVVPISNGDSKWIVIGNNNDDVDVYQLTP